MPLIKMPKQKAEQPFEFNDAEKIMCSEGFLPPEQVRAANHNTVWLRRMLDDEERDASPDHTERDIFKAIRSKDTHRLLTAAKNLTIQEKNSIVKRIRYSLLSKQVDTEILKKPEVYLLEPKEIAILEEEDIDLFDFCVRLISATKR